MAGHYKDCDVTGTQGGILGTLQGHECQLETESYKLVEPNYQAAMGSSNLRAGYCPAVYSLSLLLFSISPWERVSY